MKNLLKKVLSVAAATALLMTSVISASAAGGHAHDDGKPITAPTTGYTITLTHPSDAVFDGNSKYGAYQIFSGTVKGEDYTGDDANPGSDNEKIPITDIKWGNAFGIVGDEGATQDTIDYNIMGFLYALAKAPTGDYQYAFSDFTDFQNLFDGDKLNSEYVKADSSSTIKPEVTVTVAKGLVTNIDNNSNVDYDKLAIHVADILSKHANREWLQAFNDILGGFGKGTTEGTYANPSYVKRYYTSSSTPSGSSYTITVPAGYYMIRDLSSFTSTDKSYSARMLFVANNIEQQLKESVPTLEKHIVRDGAQYETEAAGVGDEVKFRLTGTLPSNYDLYVGGYQYIFTDELSDGLTLKEIEADAYVTVKVKGLYNKDGTFVDTLTDEYIINKTESIDVTTGCLTHTVTQAYTEAYNTASGKNELTVTFLCLKEIKITVLGTDYYLGKDSEIYVDYTAVVNENAIVSPANGNKNTATLTYSDNPQSYGDTDTTKSDNATVYTFGLDIVKVDAADFLKADNKAEDAALDGAQFVVLRRNGTSDLDYQWQIAKFKWVAPSTTDTTIPKSFQDNGYNTIFEWENIGDLGSENFSDSWITVDYETTAASHAGYDYYYNITSLENTGALNISGLNDGVTYTIAETKTPNDALYAKIAPFTVLLTPAQTSGEYNGKLQSATTDPDHTVKDEDSFSIDNFVELIDPKTGKTDDNGSANMLVANFKYTDLPSTGGIGVYIYYIAGGCVVALALVLFALSKKKKTTK